MEARAGVADMTLQDVPRRLHLVEEAAEALSLSRTMVYELIRTGELRSVKVGRARRVPADAIDEFVANLLAESDGGSGAA